MLNLALSRPSYSFQSLPVTSRPTNMTAAEVGKAKIAIIGAGLTGLLVAQSLKKVTLPLPQSGVRLTYAVTAFSRMVST